ncbi:beta-galactosidase [Rhodanobacter sp. L36]|uniref:beta-galactosidase n=1 Tax=Rhodanobacter sp. L36 TaxID=1747221 RepID=UPI00131E007F|nr:beta-galactosidase [Rhodanobacter sp. L36]
MRRRSFLQLAALTPFADWSWHSDAMPRAARELIEQASDGKPHRFQLASRDFLLDGHPFQIRSGEMHPARIPVEYWLHRIRMAKAMGLNTISIYLMWNHFEREPGEFDFHTGNRDFVHFIRLCQHEGMWVYLRPGPYICGEWDFGGLPPYLLRHPHIRVRNKDDADYMNALRRYVGRIAEQVAPLMARNGGPVLMFQIENEYASFGNDLAYMKELLVLWQSHGIDGPFSISDGLGAIQKTRSYLPGTALGLDGDTDFVAAQLLAGDAPVWMGEGYPGWITHWGDQDFQRGDLKATLQALLQQGRSFNMYVVHGGTNFGFSAGANADDDGSHFEPVITSYDYGAPINERGEPTADYHAFRALIAASARAPLPAIPAVSAAIRFPALQLEPHASLWDNLPPAKQVTLPQANELLFAQDHGMVLYRKRVHGGGMLSLDGLRDYATVFRDGHYMGFLSRMQKPKQSLDLQMALPASDDETMLEILVDSFGHVNYGHAMSDRKGIVSAILLDGHEQQHWDVHSLPLDDAWLAGLRPIHGTPSRPGVFFRATFALRKTGDTYIDMSAWDKGYLWINGRLLGRYWNIGPQQRLYCPASWLRAGHNEVLVLDMHRTEAASIRGVETLKDADHAA